MSSVHACQIKLDFERNLTLKILMYFNHVININLFIRNNILFIKKKKCIYRLNKLIYKLKGICKTWSTKLYSTTYIFTIFIG